MVSLKVSDFFEGNSYTVYGLLLEHLLFMLSQEAGCFANFFALFQISQGRYINSLFRDGVLLLKLTIKDVSPKHYTTRYLGRPQKIQSQAPDICGYSRICSQ